MQCSCLWACRMMPSLTEGLSIASVAVGCGSIEHDQVCAWRAAAWLHAGADASSPCHTATLHTVQAAGTVMQAANLTSDAAAGVKWTYFPQPALDVTLMPTGGCPDDSTTCLLGSKYCATGGDALVRALGCAGSVPCPHRHASPAMRLDSDTAPWLLARTNAHQATCMYACVRMHTPCMQCCLCACV